MAATYLGKPNVGFGGLLLMLQPQLTTAGCNTCPPNTNDHFQGKWSHSFAEDNIPTITEGLDISVGLIPPRDSETKVEAHSLIISSGTSP